VSSLATSPGAPLQRFAAGFARFSGVVSAIGLLVAIGLSVPSSWFDFLPGTDERPSGPSYTDLTPAAPVRVAVGGLSGVQLVAPLVSSAVRPRQALVDPPDDAPLVSWWNASAKAGASHGQTVLLGHAAATGGGLTQLAQLGRGDFVELLSKQGTMRYQVSSVRTFDPATMDRVGPSLFKQDGGGGRLVVLSAEGWDGAAYQRTVVVTASPLGEPAA
jgi:sortase family protein